MDDMNKKIESVEDTLNRYVSAARGVPKEKITAAIYILITLILVGFFQFITADFKQSLFLTAEFWLKEATTLIIIFTSYQGGINVVWNEQLKNSELVAAMEEYESLNVKELDFEEFLHIYNKKLKIEAYSRRVEKRIRRLEICIDYSFFIKMRNFFYNKIKDVKEQAEEVKADIENHRVKYYKVYISDFFTVSGKGTSPRFKSRGNTEVGKLKASVKGFPFTIAIATLMSSTAYQLAEGAFTINVIVNLVINAIIFGWRLANGILKASRVIYSEIQLPLQFKNQILKEYHAWQKEKKENVENKQCA